MRAASIISTWTRWFGLADQRLAAGQLRLHVRRLDEAYDLIGGAIKAFAGCPDEEIEQQLRVARISLDEAIDMLNATAARLEDADGPHAA